MRLCTTSRSARSSVSDHVSAEKNRKAVNRMRPACSITTSSRICAVGSRTALVLIRDDSPARRRFRRRSARARFPIRTRRPGTRGRWSSKSTRSTASDPAPVESNSAVTTRWARFFFPCTRSRTEAFPPNASRTNAISTACA